MNKLALWRNLTLVGLLGLMALIVLWNVWLAPVQHVPRWFEVLVLLAPLLLLVRGIWLAMPKPMSTRYWFRCCISC